MTKSTTTEKPSPSDTAAKSAAAKPSAVAGVTKVTQPAEVAGAELKKRALTDLVVKRSGVKKKDAKPVVEAMLAVLGETLAEGRELNLPPFGKMKINRTKDLANARIIVCKLRQRTGPAKPPKDPLAEAAE